MRALAGCGVRGNTRDLRAMLGEMERACATAPSVALFQRLMAKLERQRTIRRWARRLAIALLAAPAAALAALRLLGS